MQEKTQIPYKIYLNENEMPDSWYNIRADMKIKPAPLLNPETHKPCTLEELEHVFCHDLVEQELNEKDALIPIPKEILGCLFPFSFGIGNDNRHQFQDILFGF